MNPLVWLQTRIDRGWQKLVFWPAILGVIVLIMIAVSYRITPPRDWGGTGGTWLAILSGASVLLVVVIASHQIRTAVLRDFTTRMIESHRLSPMTDLQIGLGYIVGGPLQALAIYAMTVVIGLGFAVDQANRMGSALVLTGWLSLHVAIWMLAAMVMSLALLVALATNGKISMAMVLAGAAVVGGAFFAAFVPGVGLLLGVLTGFSLFEVLQGGGAAVDLAPLLLSGVLQVALGAVLFHAAMRRVRRVEGAALPAPHALLTTLIVGVALVYGAWTVSDLSSPNADERRWQWLLSAATFVAVAQFGLYATALQQFQRDRAAAFGVPTTSWEKNRRILVPLLVGAASVAVVMLLWYGLQPALGSQPLAAAMDSPLILGTIVVALLAGVWLDYHIYYLAATTTVRGQIVAWGLGLVRVLPVIVGLILLSAAQEMDRQGGDAAGGFLMALSPIGVLVALGDVPEMAVFAGVGVQVLVAGPVTFWALRRRKRLLALVQTRETAAAAAA